jgi:hypothetical protein
MMIESPRVLVGTLYCGENEFEALKDTLQSQTYPHWEHVVYKNLPNKEAHDRLYQTFMEQQDDFDLFLKLDADMVFRTREGLKQIVRVFEEGSDLDHLILAVRDWYSDSLIEGLHVFSDRAQWEIGEEDRFVDPSPSIPGTRRELWTDPAPVIDHSPDPSPFQAFRFGIHRALKVVQRDRWMMVWGQVTRQWNLLRKCWVHFEECEDRRLGLALLGAEEVFEDQVDGSEYDQNQDILRSRLEKYENMTTGKIKNELKKRWEGKWGRNLKLIPVAGFFRSSVSYGRKIVKGIIKI